MDFALIFWILIIVGLVLLIKYLWEGGGAKRTEESALEILKKRYARGEISKEEFEERKVVYSPGYSFSGFRSNGERIFFTATSNSCKAITSSIGTMTMRGGMMGCAVCHGIDGKGRRGSMMMRDYEAPDIRYSSLTTPGHGGHMVHEGEPPFTNELILK